MATEKQKKAIEKIVENHGNVSKSMLEAGYSPASAKNPKNLTQSQAFQQYMHQAGVTDEKLVDVLKGGLDATKTVVMGGESKESFVDIQPDYQTRHKYLETALKVKGIGKDAEAGSIYNFTQIINEKGGRYAD